MERQLLAIPGVQAVHDLHVWTITSGLDSMSGDIVMSGHIVAADLTETRHILRAVRAMLASEFKIDHVTIQVEEEALRAEEQRLSF